jgi:hypothetical protein
MSNINLKEHYLTFRWAVSKNWKDKNELYQSIQYKIKVLTEEYGLSIRDITDDLFADYWERGHYNKYNKNRGSLNNWIANYVNLYLYHIIRRYSVRSKNIQDQRIDPLDQRNQANLVWLDKDNERDDPDYQPDIIFDPANPENLLIAKEIARFACEHFSKAEIDYLMGEIDLMEAASLSGITGDAFRKRIERRKADFRKAMKVIDMI